MSSYSAYHCSSHRPTALSVTALVVVLGESDDSLFDIYRVRLPRELPQETKVSRAEDGNIPTGSRNLLRKRRESPTGSGSFPFASRGRWEFTAGGGKMENITQCIWPGESHQQTPSDVGFSLIVQKTKRAPSSMSRGKKTSMFKAYVGLPA